MQDKPGGKAGGRDAGKRQTQLISPILTKGNKKEPSGGAKKLDQQLKKLHSGSRGGSPATSAPRRPPQPPGNATSRQASGSGASTSGRDADGAPISVEDRIASAQMAARQKQKSSTYVRPKQKQRPPDQLGLSATKNGSIERLEKAVVCGKLWHSACRAASGDESPSDLPVSFQSPTHYISAYEPLIFEEAREMVLHAKLDQHSVQTQAVVSRLDSLAGGWSEIGLSLESQDTRTREGCIIVLSSHRLPDGGSMEWYVDLGERLTGKRKRNAEGKTGEETAAVVLAGVIRSAPSPGRRGEVVLAVHPCCPAHSTPGAEGPCVKALAEVRPGQRFFAMVLAPPVTVQREFVALHKVPGIQVGEYMLHPERLAQLDKRLNGQQQGPPRLPLVCCGEGVMHRMRSQFDETQFGAIAAATRHCDPGEQAMPFVLICGPPGTGKTHTVTGILNVWHLAQYTQHQNSLQQQLRGGLGLDPSGPEARAQGLAHKPRLLVCAPSNAAADELLQRVMLSGFTGNDGRAYFPNVVRVGAPGANIGEQARAVLVDGLVQGLLDMDPRLWQQQALHADSALQQLTHIILALQSHLASLDIPETEGSARDVALRQEDDAIRQLVERHDARAKLLRQRERLALVADHVHRRPGANLNAVREAVELLYVEEAEMVFTTLSSTGRKVFGKLSPGHFETVLIDEAAQASEVTSLQALTFGCRRVVLVGDPQQLPATVLSQKGRDLLFERSLFERLQQAGCPVNLLEVQYRMHPHIRQFPSAYFYHNRLRDGESVLARPPEVFYRNPLLKPYVFFDVAGGRDVVSGTGGSRRNQAEADLAVALFQVLREELLAAMQRHELKAPVVVGVITPYREQVACIQATLRSVLGPQLAAEVNVSTVDSYQGRQLDVIILSCVRASPAGAGVGFVADMRRMNVSITRAKKALWVLGAAATLRRSPVWEALLQDAGARGVIVPGASAKTLFPHLQQFQPGFRSQGEAQPPAGRPGLSDQEVQDAGAPATSAGMMEQLELGVSNYIPGVGPTPSAPRSRQGSQPPGSREASRPSSPLQDDSHLYDAKAAKPAGRPASIPGPAAPQGGAETPGVDAEHAGTPDAELEPGEIAGT